MEELAERIRLARQARAQRIAQQQIQAQIPPEPIQPVIYLDKNGKPLRGIALTNYKRRAESVFEMLPFAGVEIDKTMADIRREQRNRRRIRREQMLRDGLRVSVETMKTAWRLNNSELSATISNYVPDNQPFRLMVFEYNENGTPIPYRGNNYNEFIQADNNRNSIRTLCLTLLVETPDVVDVPEDGYGVIVKGDILRARPDEIIQYYRHSLNYNCVLSAIVEQIPTKKRICDKLNEQYYKTGCTKADINDIAKQCKITIKLYSPLSLNEPDYIAEYGAKVVSLLNTHLDHVDRLSVLVKPIYIDEQEMKVLANEVDFAIITKNDTSITSLRTQHEKYKLIKIPDLPIPYKLDSFKLFLSNNPLVASMKTTNGILTEFIASGVRVNSQFHNINYTGGDIHHIDMYRCYTNPQCDEYIGYPPNISIFKQTTKHHGIGYYYIDSITHTDNKYANIFKFLSIYQNNGVYTSAELNLFDRIGTKYTIRAGAWSNSNTDLDWTGLDYRKSPEHPREYCRVAGMMLKNSQYQTQYIKSNVVEYLNDDFIKYDDEYVEHRSQITEPTTYMHIFGFIVAYNRINMIHQIAQFEDLNNIACLAVDAIYYGNEAPKLVSTFRHKDFTKVPKFAGGLFCYAQACYNDLQYIPTSDIEYSKTAVIYGPGGSGKTYATLNDKSINHNLLYVSPSHLLAQECRDKYNVQATVLSALIPQKVCHYTRSKIKSYANIVIDEVSQIPYHTVEKLKRIYSSNTLIFMGDTYQLPPCDGLPHSSTQFERIYHKDTLYRCKCEILKNLLEYVRDCIDDNIDIETVLSNIVLPTIKIDDIKHTPDSIILTYMKKSKAEIDEMFYDTSRYVCVKKSYTHNRGDIVDEKRRNCYKATSFTVHSFQGRTINSKIYINPHRFTVRMLYTALSRACYMNQIVLIE
jgi:hypothetical protein